MRASSAQFFPLAHGREAKNAHAGRPCRRNAGNAVLYDEAVSCIDTQRRCRMQKEIGGWLGELDILGTEQAAFEKGK